MKEIIIGIIIFILMIGLIGYLYMKEDYMCDIGEIEVPGDYKVFPETFFNQRQCAIKDCSIFNNYQKQIGGKELCVV